MSLEQKEDQDFIGWFMIQKTDLEFPEVGFMIVKKYWQKSFASGCLDFLIQYAFENLDVSGLSAQNSIDSPRLI